MVRNSSREAVNTTSIIFDIFLAASLCEFVAKFSHAHGLSLLPREEFCSGLFSVVRLQTILLCHK